MHFKQSEEPDVPCLNPDGQDLQDKSDESSFAPRNVPGAHWTQLLPVEPSGQSVQEDAPSFACVQEPIGQSVQKLSPILFPIFPEGHCKQAEVSF